MKLDKSKCRDPKCYCRNEQELLPSMSDMQACIGTGEVEGKPEMPERIWANPQLGEYEPICYDLSYTEYLRADKVRELVRLHEDFRDLLLKYRFTPGVPDELNAKAEEIDNLQSALFPEGVEK